MPISAHSGLLLALSDARPVPCWPAHACDTSLATVSPRSVLKNRKSSDNDMLGHDNSHLFLIEVTVEDSTAPQVCLAPPSREFAAHPSRTCVPSYPIHGEEQDDVMTCLR